MGPLNIPPETFKHFVFETSEGNMNALVNIGLKNFKHQDVYPYHFSLYFNISEETLSGFPQPDEIERIWWYREHISDIINEHRTFPHVIFLARVAHEGMIELVWRVAEPDKVEFFLERTLTDIFYSADWFHNLYNDEDWNFADFYLEE
ncbi:MAG: DUF695 domain-containing protein [Flavobacterium sp.]